MGILLWLVECPYFILKRRRIQIMATGEIPGGFAGH
jgi:hypothetical protein